MKPVPRLLLVLPLVLLVLLVGVCYQGLRARQGHNPSQEVLGVTETLEGADAIRRAALPADAPPPAAAQQSPAEVQSGSSPAAPSTPTIAPDQLSYYNPKMQLTVNVRMGPPVQDLSLAGPPLPSAIVVASDLGTNVTCVSPEGKRQWTVDTYPYDPRGVACRAGLVYLPFNNEVRVHRCQDGSLVRCIPFDKRLYMLHVAGDLLIVGYENVDAIEVYQLPVADEPPKKIFTCPVKSEHARFADVLAGKLYVADTFGQRVFGVDITSGEMEFEVPMYYPNDVKAIDANTLLIAEEHGNRIVKYKISEDRSTVVYGCPLELFANPAHGPKELERHEGYSTWTRGGEFPGIGCCSERVVGPDTLYSPNGVTPYGDNGYFIADTDNHRIVYLHNGRMTTRVYGFNNPVKVAVVQ